MDQNRAVGGGEEGVQSALEQGLGQRALNTRQHCCCVYHYKCHCDFIISWRQPHSVKTMPRAIGWR